LLTCLFLIEWSFLWRTFLPDAGAFFFFFLSPARFLASMVPSLTLLACFIFLTSSFYFARFYLPPNRGGPFMSGDEASYGDLSSKPSFALNLRSLSLLFCRTSLSFSLPILLKSRWRIKKRDHLSPPRSFFFPFSRFPTVLLYSNPLQSFPLLTNFFCSRSRFSPYGSRMVFPSLELWYKPSDPPPIFFS